MESKLKYWWMILIKGILLILLSLFIFNHPVNALIGLALYIGISLLITGFVILIAAIADRKANDNWGWQLIEGILDIVFGFVLLTNPDITAAVFPFIVGFWMIVYGIILFAGSFSAKKEGDTSWWMNLLGGVLTIIFGYFIMTNMLVGAIAITIWLAIGILLFGIINISIALRMRKLNAS